MTVDVEDYFQVEAFFPYINRADWDKIECRIERNVDRILQLFADHEITGTFFTLGWIAKRYPRMVQRIVAGGHELASHGVAHIRADHLSRVQLANEVRTAKEMLENIGGAPVWGYRATSFSITRRNLWALNVLEEAGYRYSSSTHPIKHDLYGIPEQPLCLLSICQQQLCGDTGHDRAIVRLQLAGGRWRLFQAFPLCIVQAESENRAAPGPKAMHILFPSLGNRSRSAKNWGYFGQNALSALS